MMQVALGRSAADEIRPGIYKVSKDVIACHVINPDHIDIEFQSIGGLETIKQALYELVILLLRRLELFSHGKLLGPQKGVLLYGPSSIGKTMVAKAIAKESGVAFIHVRISNCWDCALKASVLLIRAWVGLIRKQYMKHSHRYIRYIHIFNHNMFFRE